MPPVLSTTTRLVGAQAETLEHSPLLLERIVIALASTESVPKVLVVLVVDIGLFGVYASPGVGGRVEAQRTWAGLGESGGAAVAGEVPLGEDFDQGVFAMALHGAGVTDPRSIVVGSFGVLGRWIAGQTCEHSLAEGAEWFCAVVDAL